MPVVIRLSNRLRAGLRRNHRQRRRLLALIDGMGEAADHGVDGPKVEWSTLRSRGNRGVQLCLLAKMSCRSAAVLVELSHTATSLLLSGSLVGITIFWRARRPERVDATVAVMLSALS
jgi:hypothetical protein